MGSLLVAADDGVEAARPRPLRLVEVYPIKHVFPTASEATVCVRIHNFGDKPYHEKMPYLHGYVIHFWFDVYFNGTRAPRSLAELDIAFSQRTQIGPGESVTLIVPLNMLRLGNREFDPKTSVHVALRGLPEALVEMFDEDLPDGITWGEVRRIGILNRADFTISQSPDVLEHKPDIAVTDSDALVAAYLESPHVWPHAKLEMLRKLYEAEDMARYYKMVLHCNEPYAQIMAIRELRPSKVNAESLIQLAQSSDVSVRRMCLWKLAQATLDEAARKQVAELFPPGDDLVDALVEDIAKGRPPSVKLFYQDPRKRDPIPEAE